MKLDKNLREKMRGLLSFDVDAIEQYTPKEFKDLPEEFQPIFHLRTWTQKEQNEINLLTEKMLTNIKNSEKKQLNYRIDQLTRNAVVNLENLFDIGKDDFIEVELDVDTNCISKKTWDKITKTIQSNIYYCISSITGLVSGEKLGL